MGNVINNNAQLIDTGLEPLSLEERQIIRGSITVISTSTFTLLPGTNQDIGFNTIISPNFLGYTIVSGELVIPISGFYTVSAGAAYFAGNNRTNPRLELYSSISPIRMKFGVTYTRNNTSNDGRMVIENQYASYQLIAGTTLRLNIVHPNAAGNNTPDITILGFQQQLTVNFKGT